MTKEEGHKHLKDHLFHGLKSNLCNALHYLYDKPDSQYSQLVMASRKAETETLGSSVSEVRAKSAIVQANAHLAETKASSEPSYEAITQQITYLMSAIVNQTNPNLTKSSGHPGFKHNGNGQYSPKTFQRPKCDKRNMTCGDVGEPDIVGENAPLPDKGIPFLSGPTSQTRTQEEGQHNLPILSQ